MKNEQDLRDKTMVVTGAACGIGRDALQALALRGAHVIGVTRSPKGCCALQDAILTDVPDARLSLAVADLASQRQIRRLASDIRRVVRDEGNDRIDVLIHGAERAPRWRQVTEDGYDVQFAVNHLAPFLLTHELLPMLRAAPAARVITVSSHSHRRGSMNWRDLMYRRRYNRRAAYRQSKLANVLFTAQLNRRLGEGSSIRAYAADPGPMINGDGRTGMGGLAKLLWRVGHCWRGRPGEGARTVIFLAAEPLNENADRMYWSRSRPIRPSARALEREEAARLWTMSERLCGLHALV